jgi:hypothetical protein
MLSLSPARYLPNLPFKIKLNNGSLEFPTCLTNLLNNNYYTNNGHEFKVGNSCI